MISQVISGFEMGGEIGGVRAAKNAGIVTSGFMPRGWRTEAGPQPHYRELYGAREHASTNYPARMHANIVMADAVIWFGDATSSIGQLTIETCQYLYVDHYVVAHPGDRSEYPALAEWLLQGTAVDEVRTVFVTGERESRAPGIGARVEAFLRPVLRFLRE